MGLDLAGKVFDECPGEKIRADGARQCGNGSQSQSCFIVKRAASPKCGYTFKIIIGSIGVSKQKNRNKKKDEHG